MTSIIFLVHHYHLLSFQFRFFECSVRVLSREFRLSGERGAPITQPPFSTLGDNLLVQHLVDLVDIVSNEIPSQVSVAKLVRKVSSNKET